MQTLRSTAAAVGLAALVALGACTPVQTAGTTPLTAEQRAAQEQKFQADREAILAMAGNYRVTFDFTETVALSEGYELKEPKLSGATEVVKVIADTGEYISLQHILVVGGERKFPVKHWRQDWHYEPASVLTFVGGNAWERQPVDATESAGKWSQIVYQVDDAPRYGAIASWTHDEGMSEWEPETAWRPLPRRDATKRDDYHAIDAVNRHVITPAGWVHEQDNTKLVLAGDQPRALVREVGVNTYIRDDNFDVEIAETYWEATKDYWAAMRAEWNTMEELHTAFGLTIQGEPEELYMKILPLADAVKSGEKTVDGAAEDARAIIAEYTRTDIGALETRLASVATRIDY